jgi:hypothetical protein
MSKDVIKYVGYPILIGGAFFLAAWLFNHVNPWVGLGAAGLILIIVIMLINKHFIN